MMRLRQQLLLLCCLLFVGHAAWAEGVTHLAFYETFDQNDGTGGNDAQFTGSIASSKPVFDAEGWVGNKDSKIYGAKECIRFGTASEDGTCTTPEIVLLGTAKKIRLTYRAAGWGTDTNNLTVTANEGVTLEGSTNVRLQDGCFVTYTVLITPTTAKSLQLTFTGRRGFLDYVKVTEEEITTVNAPTLPDEFQFWPKTTEANATTHVTLVPSDSTTVYYTTDGSEPSASNGVMATLTTNVAITGTTTVKARAYFKTVASDVVSRTYRQGVTVNSISDFKNLDNNIEARLFLSDDLEARVLHAHDGKQLYLRDKTGALCLDFGTTATFNPAPAHNQHVAGWIVGRKTTNDGLTKLVATANTNTNYLALAAPVTEAPTEPTVVTSDGDGSFSFSNHVGDWVTIREGYTYKDLEIDNVFGTENVAGKFNCDQLIDASGIIISDVHSTVMVAPLAYDDIKPIVYVINEDKSYAAPPTSIEHATVRLKRTLSKDYWNTFVVPVYIPSFRGEVRNFETVDGNTIHFSTTDQIEPGKPYLVKPYEDIVDPVFSDATLEYGSAASVGVSGGDFEFRGTYSPVQLATDKTMLFLTQQGQLAYPSEGKNLMKGMRAYFYVPNGSDAPTVVIDGVQTDISLIDGGSWAADQSEVYNLNGQRVSKPSKGIYIINGKKVIIR